MKNLILTVIAVCSLNTIQAQEISYKKWVKEAPRLEDSFSLLPKQKKWQKLFFYTSNLQADGPKTLIFSDTRQQRKSFGNQK